MHLEADVKKQTGRPLSVTLTPHTGSDELFLKALVEAFQTNDVKFTIGIVREDRNGVHMWEQDSSMKPPNNSENNPDPSQ